MQLVVGLGNPGPAYAFTRHNLGFLVLEEFARRRGLRFAPVHADFDAAEGAIAGDRLVLLRPLTHMNRSGRALVSWARLSRQRVGLDLAGRPGLAEPGALVQPALVPTALCDDIALPLGAIRVRARGSSGGHRGLESLAEVLGGNDFSRVRLGVAGSEGLPAPELWADYVLSNFTPAERLAVAEMVDHAVRALGVLLAEGPAVAAVRCNRSGKQAAA